MERQDSGEAGNPPGLGRDEDLNWARLKACWDCFPVDRQVLPLREPLRCVVRGLLCRECVARKLDSLNELMARYWPSLQLPVELHWLCEAMDAVLSSPERCCPERRTRRPAGPRTAGR